MDKEEAIEIITRDLAEDWTRLLRGLIMLAEHQNNSISPLHCEHHELIVMSDPTEFLPDELDQIRENGFCPDYDNLYFCSFIFGSTWGRR